MNEEKMDELLRLMRSVVPDTSDMSDAGRVGFVYRHNYDPAVQYEELDVVKFGMSLWTPKAETIGNSPPDQSQEGQENVEENDFWVMFLPGALGSDYVKKTDLSKAPTETEPGKPGISYPDGKTIFADENGMLTGATSGKELTQEEMDEQIASGDLEPGSVVFLTGEAEGTNGLAIIVDKELNENSVHAIRNSAVAKAINAANALIAENQRLIAETQALRATLDSFGLSKICPVDMTDVTEANGMVLGAWEKNASVEGSLANMIAKYQKPLRGYSRFSEVPVPNGEYEFFYVVYDGVDEDAPQKESRAWWWNGIVFGVPNRITQIAFSAFSERNAIYFRQRHDSQWYGWYKITGIDV